MKIVAITQARMGSSRLPGKVLKVVQNKTLLQYQMDSLKNSKYISEAIVATTTENQDDLIVAFCEENKIPYHRGSEKNVLKRYYEAALKYEADIIIRITSDCPLIDVEVVDGIIQQYFEGDCDYISNTVIRTYPRGLDVEVFSFATLEKAMNEATLESEFEHVTPYIYNHPEIFKLKSFVNDVDNSKYRWTVDTKEDFELVEKIINELHRNNLDINYENILSLMEKNPEWYLINAHIEQKKV